MGARVSVGLISLLEALAVAVRSHVWSADRACCNWMGSISTFRTVPPKSRTRTGLSPLCSIRVLKGCTGTLLAWFGPASPEKTLGGFPRGFAPFH